MEIIKITFHYRSHYRYSNPVLEVSSEWFRFIGLSQPLWHLVRDYRDYMYNVHLYMTMKSSAICRSPLLIESSSPTEAKTSSHSKKSRIPLRVKQQQHDSNARENIATRMMKEVTISDEQNSSCVEAENSENSLIIWLAKSARCSTFLSMYSFSLSNNLHDATFTKLQSFCFKINKSNWRKISFYLYFFYLLTN